jgi:uncharacterized protein
MADLIKKNDSIRDLEKRIIETFQSVNPEKIVLFGSFARGDADSYSDIDLIVVYPTKKRFMDRLEELYALWDIQYSADILAYTSEEYETLLRERDFIKEAVGKGRVIYESV